MDQRRKRPRDPAQLAKFVIDLATGEAEEPPHQAEETAATKFARSGGLKGGKARAEALSPRRRKQIARQAAAKRWGKDRS
ncbi:MAG: hypothetical protein K2Y71_22085 [Xanthobacteraceae bacterium]|nr:hypothetical protein [Xanthobacteraceae bacterium]